MKFIKVISIVISMLFSSTIYAVNLSENNIKTLIENEFGKNYTPFYSVAEIKPYIPEYYKKIYKVTKKVTIPESAIKFYKHVNNLYFYKFCSLLGVKSMDEIDTNTNFSAVLSGILNTDDRSYISVLALGSKEKADKELKEIFSYYSNEYKKALKYYKLLSTLDPKGKIITGFNYPKVRENCETQAKLRKLDNDITQRYFYNWKLYKLE